MKIALNSNKVLLVANTRLGYVKLKFFTTKIFCNSPKLFECRIFPEYPPRFAGLGCDPSYPLGIIILFPRIVESKLVWL